LSVRINLPSGAIIHPFATIFNERTAEAQRMQREERRREEKRGEERN
jgi:hypothetical protein